MQTGRGWDGAGYSLRFGPDSLKWHPVAPVCRMDGSLSPQGPGGGPVALLRGPRPWRGSGALGSGARPAP